MRNVFRKLYTFVMGHCFMFVMAVCFWMSSFFVDHANNESLIFRDYGRAAWRFFCKVLLFAWFALMFAAVVWMLFFAPGLS